MAIPPEDRDKPATQYDVHRLEVKIDGIRESINGNPDRDIRGVRPRLAETEAQLRDIDRLVKQDKIPERVKLLEGLVETMAEERKVQRAWIMGLAVGLGVTGVTSLGGVVLQLVRLSAGVP